MKRTVKVSLSFTLLTIGFGCAGMRDASKELADARAAKDTAKIEAICKDESLGDLNNPNTSGLTTKYTVSNRNARVEACKEAQTQASDVDGSCEDVVARRGKVKFGQSNAKWVEFGKRWGHRFAKCGKYDAIFETLADIEDMGPNSAGQQILEALAADGLPLEEEFEKYASSHSGSSFLAIERAGIAANHIGNWLDQKKAYGHCSAIAKAASGASETVRANMLFYFAHGNCNAEANALGVSLLTSNTPNFRRLACVNLGATGDKAVGAKVKILAETDTFFEVVQDRRTGALVKDFPVRDMCSEAYGKIQIRAH